MQWLVESDVHSEDMEELRNCIEGAGDKFIPARYVPFEKFNYLSLVDVKEPVMTLGSLQLCRDVLQSGVKIGAYANFKKLECSSYYPHFHKYLVNQDYLMMPFGSLLPNKENLYNWLGSDECIFIRPSSGFKQFTGAVVEYNNFERDINSFGFYDFDVNLMCVVARPRNIIDEFRFFIAGKEPIGHSSYRINGKLNHNGSASNEMFDFVTKVLDEVSYRPDPIFAMDIGVFKDGSFGIVELNSFSASGLYGTPKLFMLSRARQHILKDLQENYV